MSEEEHKRRSTDRGRLGRGFITISSVTVVGIMFNIISSVSHQAQTAVETTQQQGAAIIQLRADMQTNVENYALELAELQGMVVAMRQEMAESMDDRFRGSDYERERTRLIELMEARMMDLQHQLDQLGRGMAALHSDDGTLVRGPANGD
jgi:3-dehydroquinate dehydratase